MSVAMSIELLMWASQRQRLDAAQRHRACQALEAALPELDARDHGLGRAALAFLRDLDTARPLTAAERTEAAGLARLLGTVRDRRPPET